MRGHHDVQVYREHTGCWVVGQGGRVVSRHRQQGTAISQGRRLASRDHVELLIHGRNGRIRQKDSEGRESPQLDA